MVWSCGTVRIIKLLHMEGFSSCIVYLNRWLFCVFSLVQMFCNKTDEAQNPSKNDHVSFWRPFAFFFFFFNLGRRVLKLSWMKLQCARNKLSQSLWENSLWGYSRSKHTGLIMHKSKWSWARNQCPHPIIAPRQSSDDQQGNTARNEYSMSKLKVSSNSVGIRLNTSPVHLRLEQRCGQIWSPTLQRHMRRLQEPADPQREVRQKIFLPANDANS